MLHGLLWAFLGGEPVPEYFAEAFMVFLPSGKVQGEGTQARRFAAATQPLGLMNVDAQVVLVAVARSLLAHVAANAREEKRGIVKGRQIVQNVFDIDTRMQVEGIRNDLYSLGVAVFWDITTAVPSADNEFVCLSMRRGGLPSGAVEFVRSTLVVARLTRITGGLLQGSPLSGVLVALVMDWVLQQLCFAFMPGDALVRSCVDDMGAVVHSVDHLSGAELVFCQADLAVGLALHLGKGTVVPVMGAGCVWVVRRPARASWGHAAGVGCGSARRQRGCRACALSLRTARRSATRLRATTPERGQSCHICQCSRLLRSTGWSRWSASRSTGCCASQGKCASAASSSCDVHLRMGRLCCGGSRAHCGRLALAAHGSYSQARARS